MSLQVEINIILLKGVFVNTKSVASQHWLCLSIVPKLSVFLEFSQTFESSWHLIEP